MVRRVVVLVLALGLVAPAAASAMTRTQARKAVDRKLTAVYGDAWRHHTPSWSKPECRQPNIPRQYDCPVEFAHGGFWYGAYATVRRNKVRLYRAAGGRWVRRWRDERTACKGNPPSVVGTLWGNRPGCDALMIWQNFGPSKGDTSTARYTGFKKAILYYGTATALYPDFNLYRCSYSHETFACHNRFGDAFRWMPHADSDRTRFYTEFADGTVGCLLGVPGQLICEGFPLTDGVGSMMQFATLQPDGTFTTCVSEADDPECFDGSLQAGAPLFAPGDRLRVGAYDCAVTGTGVQCTARASGSGFAVTPLQITAVGS
jgi:hypothetical protein